MPSINLAPGTQQVAAAQKRRRRLYLLTVLILLIVAGAWGGIFIYQQQLEGEAEEIQQQLRNVQTETARLAEQADRVKVFEGRLAALGSLLDQHKDWEPVLSAIEGLVPTTVAFKSLSANAATGELLLAGTTSDVDQVAQALASFLADQGPNGVFTNGVLSGIDRKESVAEEGAPVVVSYDFQIELTFQPSILISKQQ